MMRCLDRCAIRRPQRMWRPLQVVEVPLAESPLRISGSLLPVSPSSIKRPTYPSFPRHGGHCHPRRQAAAAVGVGPI
eukprot:5831206-Prymnesium_polylepis.2